MKKLIALFPGILITITGYTQYKTIDSLKQLLPEAKTDTAKIRRLISIGIAYQEIRNDSALLYFQDALTRSLNIGFERGEIRSRHLIAFFLYDVKSDYTTALDLYLENLRAEEQAKDTSFAIYNSYFFDTRDIGIIYERIKDFDKQLEYIYKLRQLINGGIYKDSSKIEEAKGILYTQLGGVYVDVNRLDSAKYYYKKVLQYGIENENSTSIALSATGLGDTFTKEDNKDSAVYYYHLGLPIASMVKRYDIYTKILFSLGKLYWQNKQTDSAFYYVRHALELSKEKKTFNHTEELAALLAEIYYANRQPDSAYAYLKLSSVVRDSMMSADKIAQIQNLSLKTSLQRQQEEQAKKQALQDYQSKIKMYSLLAGLVVLLLISLLLFRNNKQKRNAHKKIERAYDELKSTQVQLIHSEKMASLGELTAGIAHEIQNPLNFVNNFSEVNDELLKELNTEIEKGNLEEVKAIAKDIGFNSEKINHHGKRADAIVKGMLQHSRSSNGVKESTDINALCDEYLRLSYHGLRAKDKTFNATMKTDFDESIGNINIIPQDIGRVILNLINNAFYAVTEKKKENMEGYEPTVTVTTMKLNGRVEITVKDNGTGIPQKVLDKIFQPFFTTKPTGQGTGLGLSLAYDIIKAHGGELNVETKEGERTIFIIQLPKN